MVRSDSVAICVAGAVIKDGRVLLVHRSPSARFGVSLRPHNIQSPNREYGGNHDQQ